MSDKKKTPDRVNHNLTRRQFIQHTGAAAASITFAKSAAGRENSPNERIGVGFIGCGGRSNAHLQAVNYLKGRGENVDIVAACDALAAVRSDKTYGGGD